MTEKFSDFERELIGAVREARSHAEGLTPLKTTVVPTTKPFDAADYIDSVEAIAEYLADTIESNDSAFIAYALDVVARSRLRSRRT